MSSVSVDRPDPAAAAAVAEEPPSAAAAPMDTRSGRRRRRRVPVKRRPRHLVPAVVVGVGIGIAGAILGIGGAYGVLSYVEDTRAEEAIRRDEEEFLALCRARIADIDCGCLWSDAAAAFLDDTREQVVGLLAERHSIPQRVQRIRTDRLVGPELGKQVWAAAHYCGQG